MRTTFFFVLLVYYVYNHMFLHFFKTFKMYKIHKILKIHKLYRFQAFIGPSLGATKICEVLNCTSARQMLRNGVFPLFVA
jgi:hypothetical protein